MLFSFATLMEYSIMLIISKHTWRRLEPEGGTDAPGKTFEEMICIVDAHFAKILRSVYIMYVFAYFLLNLVY